RRQFASGPLLRAPPRNERAPSRRRRSRAPLEAAPHRRAGALLVRSRRRPFGRVLVPPRARPALPRARRRADASPRRNRLARARAQRRRLPRHHAADGPGTRAANGKDRPRAVYENGIYRSRRRSRPLLGALRLGAGASLAQLCFARWHRPAHAELAEGPQRQPWL